MQYTFTIRNILVSMPTEIIPGPRCFERPIPIYADIPSKGSVNPLQMLAERLWTGTCCKDLLCDEIPRRLGEKPYQSGRFDRAADVLSKQAHVSPRTSLNFSPAELTSYL